jgi:hypothetical protein
MCEPTSLDACKSRFESTGGPTLVNEELPETSLMVFLAEQSKDKQSS